MESIGGIQPTLRPKFGNAQHALADFCPKLTESLAELSRAGLKTMDLQMHQAHRYRLYSTVPFLVSASMHSTPHQGNKCLKQPDVAFGFGWFVFFRRGRRRRAFSGDGAGENFNFLLRVGQTV